MAAKIIIKWGAKCKDGAPLTRMSPSCKKGTSITWMIPLVHATFGLNTGILSPFQWIMNAAKNQNVSKYMTRLNPHNKLTKKRGFKLVAIARRFYILGFISGQLLRHLYKIHIFKLIVFRLVPSETSKHLSNVKQLTIKHTNLN